MSATPIHVFAKWNDCEDWGQISTFDILGFFAQPPEKVYSRDNTMA